MNIFERLRRAIILKRINKLQIKRKKEFKYLNEPQKIGVIVNSDSDLTKLETNKFLDYLQKKHTLSVVYFVKRRFRNNEQVPNNFFSISGRKYLKSDTLKKFLNKNLDILIAVSNVEIMKLHHIIAMSDAKLKVSPHYKEFNFADLTFIVNNNSNYEEFFNAIKKYLLK